MQQSEQASFSPARRDVEPHELRSGEYGRSPHDGNWYCRTPNALAGNLSAHDVTEHEDGTITVAPSILVEYHSRAQPAEYPEEDNSTWHGYLERGVWREC